MLCCWTMSACAADPWCSAGAQPALSFEWLPKDKAEPSLGSVRIRDANGRIVQVLENVENYREDSASLGTGTDFNNDGCPDLVVTSSMAAIGNESVTAFLYNPRTRRFELSEALSAVGGLQLDSRDRNCVTGDWKGGAQDVYSQRLCWSKGKLVLESEYDVSPRYNKEGEFQCFLHTETVYRGGKKRERTKCTKEF